MTIIRKGVSKIGTAWSKKTNAVDVAADGAQKILYSTIIPQYVWPGQMWLSWDAIDISSAGSETDPWAHGEYNMFAQFVNIDGSTLKAEFDTEGEQLDFVEKWAPLDEDQIAVDDAAASKIGMTGADDAVIPSAMKRTIFLERQYKMNLSSNAYPTNSNKIRYYLSGNWKGDVRPDAMVDVAQPKLLVISAFSYTAETYTGEASSMSGDLEINALYEKLLTNIPGHDSAIPYTTDVSLDENLRLWLQAGYSESLESTVMVPKIMRSTMSVTTRYDIYQPSPASTIHAP